MREWVGREGGERESGGVRECRVCVRERGVRVWGGRERMWARYSGVREIVG